MIEDKLFTAGGRIHCLRCTAQSKRTGQQCARPASKQSKKQKCHMHGGRGNSAPKTEAGLQRVADAHLKTGDHTKAARLEHSKKSAHLTQLEDALHLLGMTKAARFKGRRSSLYSPITNLKTLAKMFLDNH